MSIRTILPALLLVALLSQAAPPRAASARAPGGPPAQFVAGELIVGFKNGYSAHTIDLPMGAAVQRSSPQLARLNAVVIRVPAGQEPEFARKMRGRTGIRYAELNYRMQPALIPDDPLWAQQYGPAHIQAPAAWDITTGSAGVIVAVIDSGIDANHPEFAGRLLPGYDFVEDDDLPQDDCGHGTHVAGIVAASGNNAAGIAGLAWNVQVMPVRALNAQCSGSLSDVAEAMVWAVERGAQVINLSLGTSATSTLLENGSFYAYTHGAAIFAAAGNSGNSTPFYPASYAWVMSVGATDASDARAPYSNTGATLDLMAPGTGIYSTTPLRYFTYEGSKGTTEQYGFLSGTSMAAAHASGAAALLASLSQFDTPDEIYQALINTALDLEVAGRDDNTGYGLIQLADALTYSPSIVATPTPNPPATSYDLADTNKCGNLVQYNWRDATGGSTIPALGDNGYATLGLPFTFPFADSSYTTVTVSANGYLTFGGVGSVPDNFLIPSIAQPNNFVAPFWDDLNPAAGGAIYAATFGAAPNRQYVVEWRSVPRYNVSGTALTFEAVLFESSGAILFQYQNLIGLGADGASASIGVEFADGTAGQEYTYNTAGAVQAGQAILFTPYSTGATPPSDGCATYTRHIDLSGGVYEADPFCLTIADGALQHPAILQIELINSAPPMPANFLDLHHYADITLRYSPAPPLSPVPPAYVCYRYTLDDVLQAGGHPENLFFTTYNSDVLSWEQLPTSVDTGQGLILALGPHFSIYAVATYRRPRELPVTGTSLPAIPAGYLLILCCLLGLFHLVVYIWRSQR